MLVPVRGLVGAFVQARGDSYTYLSQIGLSIAVAWGVLGLYQSWQSGRAAPRWGWALAAVSAAAVVALGVVARQQTTYWRSGETIWARAASCDERNAMAHYCLGSIYAREGRLDEAIGQARQALTGDSIARYVTTDSYLLLGECLSSQEKPAAAIPVFEEAVRFAPGSAKCHSRLAIALARDGQLDRAIAEFREARRLKPDSLPERIDLANALLTKGEADEAAELCREVLRIDPHSTQAATLLRAAVGTSGEPAADSGP